MRRFASFPEVIELSLSGEFKQMIGKFNVACLFLWKSGVRISPCRA
jgi:hypothetical protein